MGEEIPEDIRKLITDYEAESDRCGGLKGADRDRSLTKQEKLIKRMRRMLETYNYSIEAGAYEGNKQSHSNQYK